MALKIHGVEHSSTSQRVLLTLAEKNVDDYSFVYVDLTKGEHKSSEYRKTLQPFRMIPVLQDGDLTLYESRAIARYLCEKFDGQGTPLYGKTAKERALVNQWLEVESQNYNGPISIVVYEKYLLPDIYGGKTDDKVVAEQLAKLEKVLDVYEAHLSKSKYLAGDSVSMADLSHLPYAHYLIHYTNEGHAITSRKHVNAWWEDFISAYLEEGSCNRRDEKVLAGLQSCSGLQSCPRM